MLAALLATLAPLAALAQEAKPADASTTQVTLIDSAGEPAGTISFKRIPTGLTVYVEAQGLSTGPNGIRLHAIDPCSPTEDLPNVALPFVYIAGSAQADFFPVRMLVALVEDFLPKLLESDGSAVIIHEHASERVACDTNEHI